MKKYYLIYQITNNINGKIYIGKHETDNLDDDYFGSGKSLNRAKIKYGLENFIKTILFYCSSREEMNLLEHYVVTPEFCKRSDVYNIMEGGQGGWEYVNRANLMVYSDKTSDAYKKFVQNTTIANRKNAIKRKNLPIKQQKIINSKISKSLQEHYKIHKHENKGKWKWSIRQRQLLKNAQVGCKNSQFGKKWIHNDVLKISFPVNEYFLYDYISEGYVLGRVRKYIHKNNF